MSGVFLGKIVINCILTEPRVAKTVTLGTDLSIHTSYIVYVTLLRNAVGSLRWDMERR